MESDTIARTAPAVGSAGAPFPRRRLMRLALSGCLLLPVLAAAACGTRRDLPEERRTRGKFGHRGD